MDPVAYKGFPKDGNWEFPPDTTFPFDARVMVKFFKVAVAEVASQDGAQTKYLNTKIVKAEVSLTQEDLHSKTSLVAADIHNVLNCLIAHYYGKQPPSPSPPTQ